MHHQIYSSTSSAENRCWSPRSSTEGLHPKCDKKEEREKKLEEIGTTLACSLASLSNIVAAKEIHNLNSPFLSPDRSETKPVKRSFSFKPKNTNQSRRYRRKSQEISPLQRGLGFLQVITQIASAGLSFFVGYDLYQSLSEEPGANKSISNREMALGYEACLAAWNDTKNDITKYNISFPSKTMDEIMQKTNDLIEDREKTDRRAFYIRITLLALAIIVPLSLFISYVLAGVALLACVVTGFFLLYHSESAKYRQGKLIAELNRKLYDINNRLGY